MLPRKSCVLLKTVVIKLQIPRAMSSSRPPAYPILSSLACIWWLLASPWCPYVGSLMAMRALPGDENRALSKAWAQSQERRREGVGEQVRERKPGLPTCHQGQCISCQKARFCSLLHSAPPGPHPRAPQRALGGVTSIYSRPAWVLCLFPLLCYRSGLLFLGSIVRETLGFRLRDPGSWETTVPGADQQYN